MSVTKTYKLLSELSIGTGPGQVQIVKCSAVLPENRMQCWKAGDVLVTSVEFTPSYDTIINGVETAVPEKEEVIHYQLCRAHALEEQGQDIKDAAAATAADNDAQQTAVSKT